ncbi:MAG: YceI family protein [Terriglobia bacterium]|nr:YceI family protein [Terriglobia bacterium]
MRRILFGFIIAFIAIPVLAQDFRIDPNHSSANFAVKHLLVSTVRGRFAGGVTGIIHLDPQDVTKSSVTADIKTDTVDTDNATRDKDLHSERFFDVQKYPDIKFQSTSIEHRGDDYVAIGNLTIKDVTKQVELPFTLAQAEVKGKKKLGVVANLEINRMDYHIDYDPTGTTVSKDVKIELDLEATEQ